LADRFFKFTPRPVFRFFFFYGGFLFFFFDDSGDSNYVVAFCPNRDLLVGLEGYRGPLGGDVKMAGGDEFIPVFFIFSGFFFFFTAGEKANPVVGPEIFLVGGVVAILGVYIPSYVGDPGGPTGVSGRFDFSTRLFRGAIQLLFTQRN